MAKAKTGQNNIRSISSLTAAASGSSGSNQIFSFGAGGGTSSGLYKQATTNTQTTSSFFYSPELTTESWLLPKSRQEILKWARIFFNLEPYIYRITMMHAEGPFSKFTINVDDESIKEFYTEMAFNDKFDLFDFLVKASLSYQKFGEAIPFGNMVQGSDKLYRWEKFVLLEPELVEVKQDLFAGDPTIELIPNQELKELIKSTKDEDRARIDKLKEEAPVAYDAVVNNKNIPLSNDHVSLIANTTDPSATRGTSPIQPLFKVLIYQDWIRLAQSAFAQRYVFPVELWKLGDPSKDIYPSDEDLTQFRTLINQSLQQPPFTIVYSDTVKYEPLSTMGKFFPVNNEYEYIQDQLLVGLGVNKNIILGEGPSFSNVKTMALHTLMSRYKVLRDKFENWVINRFFRPIAIKNNFYTVENGKKKLILPTISWNKSLDIEEEADEKETFKEFHDKGLISTKTLLSKFPNINYDEERKNLEEERGTIFDKGDKRIPKGISKPSGGGGGGGGGGLPDGGEMTVGDLPPMPEMPGEGGAGAETPGEEGGTIPEAPGEATPGGGSEAPAAPTPGE